MRKYSNIKRAAFDSANRRVFLMASLNTKAQLPYLFLRGYSLFYTKSNEFSSFFCSPYMAILWHLRRQKRFPIWASLLKAVRSAFAPSLAV